MNKAPFGADAMDLGSGSSEAAALGRHGSTWAPSSSYALVDGEEINEGATDL